MSWWFYLAGAAGMYIGLKESGELEKGTFWLQVLVIGTWPIWLVAAYVSRKDHEREQ